MKNVSLRGAYCAVVLASFLPNVASAIVIEYDLSSLGGNDYRYEYTIANDGSLGSSTALEWFQIQFDSVLYEETSLSIASTSDVQSAWDELLLGSGPGLAASYDVFALAGGLAVGEILSGFAVEFTWLGDASGPGSQTYDVIDPFSFTFIETGTTMPLSVPEPGTWLLLTFGLGALALRRRISF